MKNKDLREVMLKVLVLFLLLILSPTRCNDDVLELFRTSCPYNNFCTMDSLKDVSQFNDTRYTPCCLDCFCDEACHAYRDCCPDVHSFEPQHDLKNDVSKNAQCISTIIPTEYAYMDPNWLYTSDRYRMFNTCPSDYTDTDGIVDKCEEDVYSPDRSFEDAVIVSGPNNVMYRNIYCAMCRGATDVTRWQLKVLTCQENLASVRLEASKVNTYIMENCTLVSVLPDSLRLNSRLLQCWEEEVIKCSDNANANGTINEALIAGCENGTYMPYTDDHGFIYKNALCYQCNSFTEIAHSVCLDTLDALTRSNSGSLTKLIHSTDGFSETSPKNQCGESQIMDFYANECRTLYCPPYHAALYGKCQRIATPVRLSVIVRTVFWTTENITITQPIRLYNNSIRNMYARKQRERFSRLNCPGIAVFADIQKAPDTSMLLYVFVESHIGIGGRKCTIAGIGNVIRNQPSLSGTWIINDEVVQTQGQYSFYRNPEEDEDLIIAKEYVLYERDSKVSFLFIDEFIVCPYVEIDLDWYNKLLSMAAGPGNVTKLSSLSMKTVTLEGTYALSESNLAMCVDQNVYMFRPKSRAAFLLPSANMVVVLFWSAIMVQMF